MQYFVYHLQFQQNVVLSSIIYPILWIMCVCVIAFQEPPKTASKTMVVDLLSVVCVSIDNPHFKSHHPCYLTFTSQSHNVVRF